MQKEKIANPFFEASRNQPADEGSDPWGRSAQYLHCAGYLLQARLREPLKVI